MNYQVSWKYFLVLVPVTCPGRGARSEHSQETNESLEPGAACSEKLSEAPEKSKTRGQDQEPPSPSRASTRSFLNPSIADLSLFGLRVSFPGPTGRLSRVSPGGQAREPPENRGTEAMLSAVLCKYTPSSCKRSQAAPESCFLVAGCWSASGSRACAERGGSDCLRSSVRSRGSVCHFDLRGMGKISVAGQW